MKVKARDWLRGYLQPGPKTTIEIEAAERAGYSSWTLKNNRKRLGLEMKDGLWRLPARHLNSTTTHPGRVNPSP